MKQNYFIISLFIWLAFACSSEKPTGEIPVFDIAAAYGQSEKIVVLDDVATDIKAVFLETSDDILINGITYASLYRDKLYIVHKSNCSVFDLSGKYLGNIGSKGNGPGEYTSISEKPIFVDNYILIYDVFTKKIHKYYLDGEFISTLETPYRFSYFAHWKDDVIVGYVPNVMGDERNRVVFFNTDGEVLSVLPHYKYIEGVTMCSLYSDECSMFRLGDDLRMKEGFNDTVFTVTANDIIPEYVMHVGDNVFTEEMRWQQVEAPKGGGRMPVVFYEDQHVVFVRGMGLKSYRVTIVYNKHTKTSEKVVFYYNEEFAKQFNKEEYYISLPGGQSVTQEDGTPTFQIRNISEDGKTLIGYETPAKNEDDNPVIVLVRLN